MSTIVEFGTFSIESKMFLLWFQISALMSLVLSAELQPNPGSCPLIDTQVATLNDVKVCIQSLTKRSPTEYCGSNQADCELVFADCGQNKVTHRLLCVWRYCSDSCILLSDDEDKCVGDCLGVNSNCESSKSVQEMIDCHVNLAKNRAGVKKRKIGCPLLTTGQFDIEFEACVNDVYGIDLEWRCQNLGSVCKYADIGHCQNSMKTHWFDTRLLCVATLCDRICDRILRESSKILCKKDCINYHACKERKGEDLLLCSIEKSEKFFTEHKRFMPSLSKPLSHDKRKLVDCSVELSISNRKSYLYEKDNPFIDCIHMMITMNMDKYCIEEREICELFTDDCKRAKPMKSLYLYDEIFSQKKYQVDTYLACLGHKCSKTCSEWWKGNPSMMLKCRTDCIGDIDKYSNHESSLERLKCHIDLAARFIKEGKKQESPGENDQEPDLGKDVKSTTGQEEESTPEEGKASQTENGLNSKGADGQESKTENEPESQAENGQTPKEQVTIAMWSVLLFKSLALIFNDSRF